MKRVAWLVPEFDGGSGGIRTILQNVEYLEKNGFLCDILADESIDAGMMRRVIEEEYDLNLQGDIYAGHTLSRKYDIAIATYYATAEKVAKSSVKYKLYFMQDYEPWFFPMSINYLDAEDSYKYDLQCISIGKWLAKKIRDDFGRETNYFNFGADLEIYHPLEEMEKEKAICFIFQPEKPRRMVDLGLRALQIVQEECPEVKIYLYGSGKMVPHNLKAEHLGLIKPAECNELYNKCMVGLCLSATNPSRIPFEMMAAGLPVVEVYGENTIYDLPDAGCLLAERTPEAIATALLRILRDETEQCRLAQGGMKYMKKYSLEHGFEEFKNAVESFVKDGPKKEIKMNKKYREAAVKATDKYPDVGADVYFSPVEIKDERSELRKKLSKIKAVILEK